MSKKLICALLAFVLLIGLMPVSAIPASAANACGPDMTWKFNSKTGVLTIAGKGAVQDYASVSAAPWYAHHNDIKVVDFSSEMTVLGKNTFSAAEYPNLHSVNIWSIPAWCNVEFKGVNPLSFAHNLYYKGKIVTDLYIPKETVRISTNAFAGCYLRGVEINGDGLRIGQNAFAGCPNLKSVKIGEGVIRIRESAFANCGSLQSITIPNSMLRIEAQAFVNCTKLSDVNLGNGVNFIGNQAFANTGLKKLELPDSLLTLGAGAFTTCHKLERVVMNAGLTSIEDDTFLGCDSLVKIFIPGTVRHIGANAFVNCTSLKAVYTRSIEDWCRITFENSNPLEHAHRLYVGDTLIKDLVIPDSIATIKANAFRGCSSIESVKIPDFVHTVEANAFADCDNLKTVYISRKDRWIELNKGAIAAGNDKLVNATPVFGDSTPDGKPIIPSPIDPGAAKAKVDERLVDMIAALTPFKANASETYPGSGIYIIGYGTPANNGDKITKTDARNTLREYLMAAAGQVKNAFSSRSPALTQYELDALAAFSFKNGYGWLKGSEMFTAVNNKYNGSNMLNTFCRKSSFNSNASLLNRMCEANLYLNGKYESAAPSSYAYTRLDPNGGKSADYGTVKAYFVTENVIIDSSYAPARLGYEFLGWYTVPQEGQGKLITALDQTTNGRTLYAHWQKHDSGMHDDGFVFGKAVSYQLPAYVAADGSKDSTGRIRLFANPNDPTTHVATVEANAIVQITREYRHPNTGILWVKVQNSGWMNLGGIAPEEVKAIEPGTVKLDLMKRLAAYADDGVTETGALRNGDRVAVFARKTVGGKQYGKTVFLDAQAHKSFYTVGWIDLAFVDLDGSMHEEDIPAEQDSLKDSPNGKAPVAAGIVVNTDNLNVRSEPNVYGQFYCKLPRGAEVNIYDYSTTNGVQWALLNQGWACMQYIHETDRGQDSKPEANEKPANPGDVGTDDNKTPLAKGQAMSNITLNIRSGPGPQYENLGQLKDSNRFSIFQTKMSNGVQWGRMEKGWVCMTYVRLDGDVTITNPNAGQEGSGNQKPEQKPASLGQGRVVNCSTHVNVRASATPQSALQGTFPLNAMIELLEHTTNNGFDWYRTTKGWVCGTYVQKISAPDISTPITPVVPNPGTPVVPGTPSTATTGTITGSNSVNVRKGPGVFNAKVTSLRSGSIVNIKSTQVVDGATWYEIDQGWVAGDYVLIGGVSMGGGNAPVIGGTTETTNGKFATGTIAQAGTKVRAGAGYGYKDTRTLGLGDSVTIYEVQLLDGVAWGRISNTEWLNLAFVTLDTTGITGTGTIGNIYRCGHAVNVRSTPNVKAARMATLRLGATVEILETKNLGNETWGRTPQGWVNMYYVNISGPLPTPPLPLPDQNPAPNPTPVPTPDQNKPVDQGIPVTLKGVMNDNANLQMVPGIMGDYDASIDKGQNVIIMKLEKADGKLYGMLEAGWVDMDKIDVSAYGISEKAQLVWKDASTTTAVGALNKGELVTIEKLSMDTARKVWAKIGTDRWIELTAVTKPESYSKTFMLKGTIGAAFDQTIIRVSPSDEAEQIGEKLAAGKPVTVDGLERDINGVIWAHITDGVTAGWIKNEAVTIYTPGKVISKTLIGWSDWNRSAASCVLNQGEGLIFTEINLNNVGVPMGKAKIGPMEAYFEISSATFVVG